MAEKVCPCCENLYPRKGYCPRCKGTGKVEDDA